MKNIFSKFTVLAATTAALSVMITTNATKAEALVLSGSDIIPSTTLPTSWSRFPLSQINDGITSDASPYNGFVSNRQTGTITFDLADVYDLTSFRLWNDINVRLEGIKDFRLDFFDSSNSLIPGVSFSETAAAGSDLLQEYFFNVPGVSRVDLVVLSTYDLTSINRIEIREVQFTGTPYVKTVPEPTSILGTGVALGLGLFLGRRKRKQ